MLRRVVTDEAEGIRCVCYELYYYWIYILINSNCQVPPPCVSRVPGLPGAKLAAVSQPTSPSYHQLRAFCRPHQNRAGTARFLVLCAKAAPPRAYLAPEPPARQPTSLPQPIGPHHRSLAIPRTSHRYRAQGARYSDPPAKQDPLAHMGL
jgi:hypothetical protein